MLHQYSGYYKLLLEGKQDIGRYFRWDQLINGLEGDLIENKIWKEDNIKYMMEVCKKNPDYLLE